ncbi:MAG TPA: hypothetical protein VIJ57_04180 [Hanamia sp.]
MTFLALYLSSEIAEGHWLPSTCHRVSLPSIDKFDDFLFDDIVILDTV